MQSNAGREYQPSEMNDSNQKKGSSEEFSGGGGGGELVKKFIPSLVFVESSDKEGDGKGEEKEFTERRLGATPSRDFGNPVSAQLEAMSQQNDPSFQQTDRLPSSESSGSENKTQNKSDASVGVVPSPASSNDPVDQITEQKDAQTHENWPENGSREFSVERERPVGRPSDALSGNYTYTHEFANQHDPYVHLNNNNNNNNNQGVNNPEEEPPVFSRPDYCPELENTFNPSFDVAENAHASNENNSATSFSSAENEHLFGAEHADCGNSDGSRRAWQQSAQDENSAPFYRGPTRLSLYNSCGEEENENGCYEEGGLDGFAHGEFAERIPPAHASERTTAENLDRNCAYGGGAGVMPGATTTINEGELAEGACQDAFEGARRLSDKFGPRPLHRCSDDPLERLGILQTLVISLGGERWATAQTTLDSAGFRNYERWNGVVGRDLSEHDFAGVLGATAQLALHSGRFAFYDIATPGGVGSVLSHVGIWMHVVENNIPAVLVFEDDMHVSTRAARGTDLPTCIAHVVQSVGGCDAFDVLMLSHKHAWGHGGSQQTQPLAFTSAAQRSRGLGSYAQAYVLTKRGAEKLLRYAFPLTMLADIYMYSRARVDPAFVLLQSTPPLFYHPLMENLVGSSIGHGGSTDFSVYMPKQVNNWMWAVALVGVLAIVALSILLVFVLLRKGKPKVPAPPAHDGSDLSSAAPSLTSSTSQRQSPPPPPPPPPPRP